MRRFYCLTFEASRAQAGMSFSQRFLKSWRCEQCSLNGGQAPFRFESHFYRGGPRSAPTAGRSFSARLPLTYLCRTLAIRVWWTHCLAQKLELASCIRTKRDLPAFRRVPELHITWNKPVRPVRKVILSVTFEPANGFLVFRSARLGKNLQQLFIS